MPPAPHQQRLTTTIEAVREVMAKRLKAGSLDAEAKREVEMALEMLDLMWEELQGQAALLERETQRYAEFFDYAPDAYVITDAGGSVREANQAAKELFGQDLAGRPIASIVPADDKVTFLSRFVGAISQPEGRLAWQGRIRGPDGEALGAQFSVRAIPLRKSGVAGLCWLVRPH